ncbi:MAG: type II toxin-antitoxin system RelB/DinJ family antitoxin [Defluviitaleaceae bacterium]|nr:type II toxin-antitoxin system RelB/DinJ family antitoxin [Defluviitaleaceae bacterium]MCL2275279.1 type II toxin-antitoxin system RelB/DinJ family antitoxin [Defluviitaleaceae bacterium]
MNKQINVNIRMDSDLKERADLLFHQMGLTMTTAINTFVRQCLREETIPFQIKPYDDYVAKVGLSLRQADEGKLTPFTIGELEAFEDMDIAKAKAFIEARQKEIAS